MAILLPVEQFNKNIHLIWFLLNKFNEYFVQVSNYCLDSLALVNVKRAPVTTTGGSDSSNELNLVQLLVFPEQLYLRCESARVKREWLDSVEDAKRKQQEEKALVRQATIRGIKNNVYKSQNCLARRRSILSSIAQRTPTGSMKKERRGTPIHQKIEEQGEEEALAEEAGNNSELMQRSIEDTAWLNDLINELQDVISHRHMEEVKALKLNLINYFKAVEMLLEWKSCGCLDQALNAKFAFIEKQASRIIIVFYNC